MGQKLTAKQQRFVAEYLVDLNATQAAIRAGYKAENAYQIGSENLRKPQIQKALQEAQEDRQKATRYNADWIMAQIAKIAEDESVPPRDRLKAMELMGKRYGMWEKQQEQAQGVTVVINGEAQAWSE